MKDYDYVTLLGIFTDTAKIHIELFYKRIREKYEDEDELRDVMGYLITQSVQISRDDGCLFVHSSHLAQARCSIENEKV